MAVVEAPDQTEWKRVRAVRVQDFDKATQPRIKLANPPCRAAREAFRSSGTIRAARAGATKGDPNVGPYPLRRHAETSEPIPCPSLRAKRSNPGAAVRPSGLLTPRMLWSLDCFVARAPRNDGWVAADPIASVLGAALRPTGSATSGTGLAGYSRSPSAAPSTRTSLFTELAMKQASCDL
jgi:hypothetical protein